MKPTHTILAKRLYHNAEIEQNQVITVLAGRIHSIENYAGQKIDTEVDNLAAGLFDIHINGSYTDHFTHRPSLQTLHGMYSACLDLGTAYFLPTLITSSIETIREGLAAVRAFREEHPGIGVVGMHLEGPFICPHKRGAHMPQYVRNPTDAEIDLICEEGRGVISLMTIAPELFTRAQIKKLLAAGIQLAAGHSNATYEEAAAGFEAGIGSVTHLYNAMSGLHHREPGLVGAAFTHSEVFAPIILDGVHCHYAAAKVAYQAKPSRLVLISDALFLGRYKEHFEWETFNATLQNGEYINSEGNLAGSSISLLDALRNAVQHVGIPLPKAIFMATTLPALATKLQDTVGSVAVGRPAVFSLFSDDLAHFKVYIPQRFE